MTRFFDMSRDILRVFWHVARGVSARFVRKKIARKKAAIRKVLGFCASAHKHMCMLIMMMKRRRQVVKFSADYDMYFVLVWNIALVAQTWQPISYNVIYGAIAPLYTPIVIPRIANSENIRKLASFPKKLKLWRCLNDAQCRFYQYLSFLSIYLGNESIQSSRQDTLLISVIHKNHPTDSSENKHSGRRNQPIVLRSINQHLVCRTRWTRSRERHT